MKEAVLPFYDSEFRELLMNRQVFGVNRWNHTANANLQILESYEKYPNTFQVTARSYMVTRQRYEPRKFGDE